MPYPVEFPAIACHARPGGRTRRRRPRSGPAAVAAFLFSVLVSACQPVPQPFASPTPIHDFPLARPGPRTGLVVAPVAGAGQPAALATRVAAALQKLDVLAVTTAGNRDSYRLRGRATTAPVPGKIGDLALTIRWRLSDARGRPAGERVQTTHVAAAAWRAGTAELLDRVAAGAAALLAPLAGDNVKLAAAPRVLTVHGVDGAPGDGDVSLRRALTYTLGQRGFHMTTGLDGADVIIAGAVRVTPAGPTRDQVTITWSALAPDGTSLGTVDQSNRVPKGSLDGPWGITAIEVARAAVPGIAHLLERLPQSGPQSGPRSGPPSGPAAAPSGGPKTAR